MVYRATATENKKAILLLVLIVIPVLAAPICIGIGRYSLSVGESIKVLFNAAVFGKESVEPQSYSVIIGLRLPRIILALFAGAGLAVSGASFQALFGNPLATPDTMGVAAGASFGAALALLIGDNLIWIQSVSLIVGLIAVFLTYSISRIKGRATIIMMVLSGIVIATMFQAFVSLVKYMADPEDKLPAITYWLMGSLTGITLSDIALTSENAMMKAVNSGKYSCVIGDPLYSHIIKRPVNFIPLPHVAVSSKLYWNNDKSLAGQKIKNILRGVI